MQLASYGTRAVPGRFLSRLLPRNPAGSTRQIHIQLPHPATTNSAKTVTQKVVQQTRNALTSFFAHLTAPGLRAPSSGFPAVARSMHTGTHAGIQNIRSNMSLPVRHALSRGPYLPRAPMVPRTTMQVGLGTARNFSSTRPIFQNLAQNVPIAGRAFWEADWDAIKMRDERNVQISKENGAKTQAHLAEMIKPTTASSPFFTQAKTEISLSDSASEDAADFEHYFPAVKPTIQGLTTYLLIPLAPTPTSRLPLASSPPSTEVRKDSERLLPLPELASMHHAHHTHSLRVSSLFARLDVANVWHKGVSCDAYSSGRHSNEQGEGACTILRVSFIGWTATEVRSVIGESGTGWCELYESRAPTASAAMSESDFDSEDGMSEVDVHDTSEDLASHDAGAEENRMDPSQSFVLPTLDFSSSFLAAPSPDPSPALSRAPSEADLDMFAYRSSSPGSDEIESWEMGTSSSAESWVQPSVPSRSSNRFGFGFSSNFTERMGGESAVLMQAQL